MRGYRVDRDLVTEVGPAGRESIVRTLEANVSKDALRMELAILHELLAWTRGINGIRHSRLIDLVELGRSWKPDSLRRTARNSIHELRDSGSILYSSGIGRSVSTISLPGFDFNRPLVNAIEGEGGNTAPSQVGNTAPSDGVAFPRSFEELNREDLRQQRAAAAAAALLKRLREAS